MKHNSAHARSTHESNRCQYRTRNGGRCRLLVFEASSTFCCTHARLAQQGRDAADLAALLIGQLTEFNSASAINKVLSQLLILLAQNRISARRAAVLAYITNQLLRTLPAIERELDAQSPEDAAGSGFLFDLPRPVRPPEGQPS